MNKKEVAIIPARGGSKRVPGKNLAVINGKTLLSICVENIRKSDLYDRIILSSEDSEIIKEGERLGVEIHPRPYNLSDDTTKVVDVIQDVIVSMDIDMDDILSLLQVTCPLRSEFDLQEAHRIYKSSNKKSSVVSVGKYLHPVQLSWKIDENKLTPISNKGFLVGTRKQDHDECYFWNDAIIVDSANNWMLHNRDLFGLNPIPYVMPSKRSINIDYPYQLMIAKLVAERGEG